MKEESLRAFMFQRQTKPILWIGFGGLLLLMGVLGISAISFLDRIDRRHERIRQDFVARARVLESLRSDLYLSGTHIRDYLHNPEALDEESHRRAFLDTAGRIEKDLLLYGKYLRPEEHDTFRAFEQEVRSYVGALDAVLHWTPAERHARGSTFVQDQMLPRRMAMVTLTDHIERLNEQRLEAASRETSELFAQFRIKLLALAGIVLGLGSVVAGISMWRILQLEKASQIRVAEIVRARRELQDSSARVLAAQEQERRRISRELHDEVGQALWAMSLCIDNLSAALKRGDAGEGLRQLAGMRDISDNSVRVVRNMSLLLRPSMLDDLGLLPALKWLAREVSRTSDLQVDVIAEQLPEDLPEDHKTCVYRVVQEALRNCSRHSGATHARIYVRVAARKLLLSVQDDGAGFDAARDKGLGLLGMEERVTHLGGQFQVDSEPGKGTIIGLQLPLAEKGAPQEISPLRTA